MDKNKLRDIIRHNITELKFKMIILDESGDIIQIVDLITRGESNEQQA